MKTMHLEICSLLVLAGLVSGLVAQSPKPEAEPAKKTPEPAKRVADPAKATHGGTAGGGRQALKAAAELAEKVKGLRGPARDQALEQAAKAYEEVAAAHAGEPALAAQAAYEAGELWRRGSDLVLAEAAYRKAAELDRDRYAERAWLELGNMQRRQKKWDEAVATYTQLVEFAPKSSRAHDARLWIGRTLQQKGTPEPALAAFRTALDAAGSPLEAIEAANWLAKTLITTGDLAGAEAALTAAEQHRVAGPDAERIRRALDDMSARRALQRARDKSGDAHEDAKDLEDDERPVEKDAKKVKGR